MKGLFFKGFAFLPAGCAHGIIASSFAISFASRVVQEATQRPRQLMDEPRPCSSMLSDLENRECGMAVSKSFLDSTRRMVGFGSRLRGGWLCPCRVRKWLN